jgi:hypothetical protein
LPFSDDARLVTVNINEADGVLMGNGKKRQEKALPEKF